MLVTDIERSSKRIPEFDFQRMQVMKDHIKHNNELLRQIHLMKKQNEVYIRASLDTSIRSDMELEWVRMKDIPRRLSM